MKSRLHLFLLPALIVGLNLIPAGRATAQTFTILHRFDNDDGAIPWDSLIVSGNTLYGTAPYGGAFGNGTLFALGTDGTGFTNLHRFTATSDPYGEGTNSDGSHPMAGLILSGVTLYGTAEYGGSSGNGTVFAVNTDGTGFTNLHSFTASSTNSLGVFTNSDGSNPMAGLILSGGALYGTTWQGGSSGSGTVFVVNTNGTGFTNLHSFTASSNGTNSDGENPNGLILSGNTLYGTAEFGGSSVSGTVFAVHTNGTGFTNLHSFTASSTNSLGAYTNSDGAEPVAGMILSGNILYGTTGWGGSSGNGTVFKLNTDGTGFTNLHSFTATLDPYYANSDGAGPAAGLLLSGNMLYGTAAYGGSSGGGTVFAVSTDGTGFTNLHSFTGSDGIFPFAGLALSGNNLYGMGSDYFQDPWSWGTVFSLSFPSPQLTITLSGSNVILSWPTNVAGFDYTGYTLQSTTNLASPAVWSNVAPGAVVFNGQNTVTNSISGKSRLYRLTRPGPQTWETVANMPTARDSLGAAAGADGRIYAIGGEGTAGLGGLGTVEAYTPGTPGSWATMASMPTPRYGHAVVAGKDGRIYALGGIAVTGIVATLEVYTPGTDSWATKASMPTARAWLSAAAGPDGRIYALGGADNSNLFATVEVYTPNSDSWTTATSMPTERSRLAVAAGGDGRIYAVGGYGPTGSHLDTVEAFTPNADAGTWATKAGMRWARAELGAAAGADGRIYAIGGFNDVFNLPVVEAYTPNTDSWVTVPDLPTARSSLAAATGADGRIYVIGGQDGLAAVGQKVEAYTP